jgi:hypothetical protein
LNVNMQINGWLNLLLNSVVIHHNRKKFVHKIYSKWSLKSIKIMCVWNQLVWDSLQFHGDFAVWQLRSKYRSNGSTLREELKKNEDIIKPLKKLIDGCLRRYDIWSHQNLSTNQRVLHFYYYQSLKSIQDFCAKFLFWL